jgi:hypothetical protein
MAKMMNLLNFFAWLTGIIVSLAVGLAMITKSLALPHVNPIFMIIAGYLVVVTTVLSIILVLFRK